MNWIRPPGPVADGLTIGLLGGTFDPAHAGHLHVSLTALKRLSLDYVWWLVSPGNPLKDAPPAIAERLQAARKTARHPRIAVSDIERQMGTRYTIDTVKALQRRFPGLRFVWLMGSDNLRDFDRWRNWREIALRLPVVVVERPGSLRARGNAAVIRRFGLSRRLKKPPCILVLDGARNAESATRLRSLGRRGQPC
ncbi:MAG TPA: nicotinate (nicotinamide) nucleotide adenylyltransferase [Rhizomicrobium sp.]|nr:nicotinate (nicotinamide) nucleotide adenylyltransferase [Rhizomicrobium sp.]